MNKSRRGAVATWAAAALLVSLGWTTATAPAASADVVTPGIPTIDITLPPGVSQSTLDGGSKDTVYAGTTIAIDDPVNDAYDYTTPMNADGTRTGEIKSRDNNTSSQAKKT